MAVLGFVAPVTAGELCVDSSCFYGLAVMHCRALGSLHMGVVLVFFFT